MQALFARAGEGEGSMQMMGRALELLQAACVMARQVRTAAGAQSAAQQQQALGTHLVPPGQQPLQQQQPRQQGAGVVSGTATTRAGSVASLPADSSLQGLWAWCGQWAPAMGTVEARTWTALKPALQVCACVLQV